MEREQRTSGPTTGTGVERPRVDALEKVSGQARYVEDIPSPPDVAFGAPIQSPYAHARIVSIDASRAAALPGVLGILHSTNITDFGLNPVRDADGHDFIAADKVRFVGDALGVVVAEDLRTARQAADLVQVEYELLPSIFSAKDALEPGAPLIHEELGTNSGFDHDLEWGDVDEAFGQADAIVTQTYVSRAAFHHPMENVGSCLVQWVGDVAEIWAPTNTPTRDAVAIGRLLGMSPENVRVRVPFGGGGFGSKKVTIEIKAALVLSRKIGRPVKLRATEAESFTVGVRHTMDFTVTLGVKKDGSIVALDADVIVDDGAYAPNGVGLGTRNAIISAWGAYRIPHLRARAKTVYTNKAPSITHRGTGRTQPTFAVESIMDKAAHELGISPLEIREKNMVLPGDTVGEDWKVDGKDAPAPFPLIVTDYRGLLRQASESLEGLSTQASTGEVSSTKRVGRGMAVSLRHLGRSRVEATALVTLEPGGKVRVSHNATDYGQGIYTMIGVVTQETLGIDLEDVIVEKPDTSNKLAFDGVNAQRTTVEMGNAVHSGCRNLADAVAEVAAKAKGGSAGDWTVTGGEAVRGNERLSLAEVVRLAGGNVVGVGYDRPDKTEQLDPWTAGAAAAEVEVDTETGEVRVLQYVTVADAGKVLHYGSAAGQVVGGAIMGFGLALTEELVHEGGQVQNADAFQYRLPLMLDVPEKFQVDLLEFGGGPGPFGSKGVAQTSIPCVAPAIGNAIYDAIGVQLPTSPFTPDRVLAALGKIEPEAEG